MARRSLHLACVATAAATITLGAWQPLRAAESIVVSPPAPDRGSATDEPLQDGALIGEAQLTALRLEILAEIRTEIRREMSVGIARLENVLGAERSEEQERLEQQLIEDERRNAQRLERLQREEQRLEQLEAERRIDYEEDRAAQLAADGGAAKEDDGGSRVVQVGSAPGDATCLDLPDRQLPFGSIGLEDWRSWVPGVQFSTGAESLSIDVEPEGRAVLRQRYQPSSEGSSRVVTGARLPHATTYRLVQSIQFEPGWDWGGDRYQGGKVGFGLSGGTSPSGGKVDPAGFTARLMWRGNLDGTGRLVVYSYAADRPDRHGEDFEIGNFEAPVGEWFDVAMELTTNSTVDASDGKIRVWVDGELMLDRGGIAWQTAGGTPTVDNLYYSSFYGGGSAEWSPDGTTFARVTDVCWAPVIDGQSGIDPEAGRLVAPAG